MGHWEAQLVSRLSSGRTGSFQQTAPPRSARPTRGRGGSEGEVGRRRWRRGGWVKDSGEASGSVRLSPPVSPAHRSWVGPAGWGRPVPLPTPALPRQPHLRGPRSTGTPMAGGCSEWSSRLARSARTKDTVALPLLHGDTVSVSSQSGILSDASQATPGQERQGAAGGFPHRRLPGGLAGGGSRAPTAFPGPPGAGGTAAVWCQRVKCTPFCVRRERFFGALQNFSN